MGEKRKPIGMLGKRHTDEAKNKIRIAHLGDKNVMWRGDKVGYIALHAWIKRRKVKSDLCEICHKTPPYDLANKSGEYKRDLSDWEWLCRKCHMIKDGRISTWNKSEKRIRKGKGHWNWKGGYSKVRHNESMKKYYYKNKEQILQRRKQKI